jgi:hypothetical protein
MGSSLVTSNTFRTCGSCGEKFLHVSHVFPGFCFEQTGNSLGVDGMMADAFWDDLESQEAERTAAERRQELSRSPLSRRPGFKGSAAAGSPGSDLPWILASLTPRFPAETLGPVRAAGPSTYL